MALTLPPIKQETLDLGDQAFKVRVLTTTAFDELNAKRKEIMGLDDDADPGVARKLMAEQIDVLVEPVKGKGKRPSDILAVGLAEGTVVPAQIAKLVNNILESQVPE